MELARLGSLCRYAWEAVEIDYYGGQRQFMGLLPYRPIVHPRVASVYFCFVLVCDPEGKQCVVVTLDLQ
jgi:hypothetical protein